MTANTNDVLDATEDAMMRLYWTPPSNYPGAPDEDDDDLRTRWYARVDRLVDGEWDPLTGGGTGDTTGLAQWVSVPADVASLKGGTQRFRVVYFNDNDNDNPGPNRDTPNTTDPIEGVERVFDVNQLSVEQNEQDDLPRIAASADRTNGGDDGETGLRFKRNRTNPTTSLTLEWDADRPDATGNTDVPTGYVIDVSHDEGMTWYPLANVQAPSDLGATRGYNHRGLEPGQLYTYRVFPEFENFFGYPAKEDASSEAAKVPVRVEGLDVEPTTTNLGNQALKLTWDAVSDTRGLDLEHYLIQIATGDTTDNNDTLNASPAWMNLDTTEDGDTRMYTYSGDIDDNADDADLIDDFGDTLGAAQVRWFRVIAITAANDGDATTPAVRRWISQPATQTTPERKQMILRRQTKPTRPPKTWTRRAMPLARRETRKERRRNLKQWLLPHPWT